LGAPSLFAACVAMRGSIDKLQRERQRGLDKVTSSRRWLVVTVALSAIVVMLLCLFLRFFHWRVRLKYLMRVC
jgi:hypothetical protein